MEAVTFDLWNTLIYLTASARRSFESARRAAWTRPIEAAGRGHREATAIVRALESEGRRRELLGRNFPIPAQVEWIRKAHGLELPVDRVVVALERGVEESTPSVAPGVEEMLARLRREGFALALVSNVIFETGRSTRRLLARLALIDGFDSVVLSVDLGVGKPSPRPLRAALAEMKVRPSQAMHVGDLSTDVIAALRAGVAARLFDGLARFAPPPPPGLPPVPRGTVTVHRWSEFSPV